MVIFFEILCYNDLMRHKNTSQHVELIKKYSKKALEDILNLEKECFPLEWQYPDAEEYYKKILKDKENISIFLSEGDKRVGYILARAHNKIFKELYQYDPSLKKDDHRTYIETIQILPKHQGKGGATKLIIGICDESARRGINSFSIHARTKNHFHDKIKKIFNGRITETRKIKSWKPGGGELYEYLEWKYKN
jgi:ribosomal protein S18 acetylase RimI-like enzyme